MNKYLKYALITLFVIIIFFFSYYELFNQFLQSPANSLEASNTTIQFLLLITGIVTIFFLYINYDQQRKHIKIQQEEIASNTQDVEFNRLLDIVYRQFEISLPQIKSHSTYRTLNRLMNDFNIPDYDRVQEIESYSESILTFLINTQGLINNFLFIIRNSNLELERKNFIRNIICNNLNSNFFWVFESFKNFCLRYPNDTWGMLEHIQDILLINEEITD